MPCYMSRDSSPVGAREARARKKGDRHAAFSIAIEPSRPVYPHYAASVAGVPGAGTIRLP